MHQGTSKNIDIVNLAHRLLTPMTAINGLSDLLLLTALDEQQKNYVNNILRSSDSLLNAINGMLDLSRLAADETVIELSEYELSELLVEVGSIAGRLADEDGLDFELDISPELPSKLIGDSKRLKGVMLNLLSNATNNTAKGSVRLSLSGKQNENDFWLECHVVDTGCGIRESDISGLFERTASPDSQASAGRTGLGLQVSKALIDAMGGELSFSSTYGEGSDFCFRVPQQVADVKPLAYVDDAQSKSVLILGNTVGLTKMLDSLGVSYHKIESEAGLSASEPPNFTHCLFNGAFRNDSVRRLRKMSPYAVFADVAGTWKGTRGDACDTVLTPPLQITKVAEVLNSGSTHVVFSESEDDISSSELRGLKLLVVDDNEINLMVSCELLRSLGAEVHYAESGFTALEMCAETRYDMIFMDHIMPEMDGIETTRELRSQAGPNNKTPVVALTANVLGDMREAFLQCGMDDIINKPVNAVSMTRVLRRCLPLGKLRN